MRRALLSLRLRMLRAAFALLIPTTARGDLRRLGSAACGWVVPVRLLEPGSVCYCVGAGEDITFDVELARSLGCEVFVYDPTPRARVHVEARIGDGAPVTFMPVGIWTEDGVARFYAPRDPRHVSHSIVNLQETAEHFDAPVRTVSSLMRELGHGALTLLKLDIEGAEHAVLGNVIDTRVDVRVICVEFDQPVPLTRVLRTVGRLRRAGYLVCAIDWMNFTFVRGNTERA